MNLFSQNSTRIPSRASYIIFAAIAFSGLHAADGAPPQGRPNIIFLMDDQRRWDALGVVNPEVKTPHLDLLAKAGIRYEQAVCQAPMCVPSRNSMMFGLYPNQTGVKRNAPSTITDERLPAIPLPEVFRRAGYQTAGFGKTHWGTSCSTRGFEVRYESEIPESGAIMMKDHSPDAKARYDAESSIMGQGEENNIGYLGFTSKLPEHEHRDGWVHDRCLEFIEKGVDRKRPLFLYLSFLKPHAGHNVPAGYEDRYDLDKTTPAVQPPWKEDRSRHADGVNQREYVPYWSHATREQWKHMTLRYRANCTWVDDMFGRTLAKLREKGLLENALIVYCSDHGEMLGERYYRFNKYCLYESSVRVPLILSGSFIPETKRGGTDQRAAELVDLYPTLLRAAGIAVPDKAAGIDLLDDRKRAASFCALHERKDEAAFMWRTRETKLILVMKRRNDASEYTEADIIGGEFYDLKNDPQEWNDLYTDPGASRQTIGSMTRDLLAHLKTQKPLGPDPSAIRGR